MKENIYSNIGYLMASFVVCLNITIVIRCNKGIINSKKQHRWKVVKIYKS